LKNILKNKPTSGRAGIKNDQSAKEPYIKNKKKTSLIS